MSREPLSSSDKYSSVSFPTTETILKSFSKEEQEIILKKAADLKGFGWLIGADGSVKIELNLPNSDWHYDFLNNTIRINPTDLLTKDFEELIFIMAHEGAHRKISILPEESLKPKDSSPAIRRAFLMLGNVNEDGRVNNFIYDSYPVVRSGLESLYQSEYDDLEAFSSNLQNKPKFLQLYFLYLQSWFNERLDKPYFLPYNLSDEVITAYENTINYARRLWWVYPTFSQSNNPEMVKIYAQEFNTITLNFIWPEVEKLINQEREKIENDLLDQAAKSEGGEGDITEEKREEIKKKLTEEQKEIIRKEVERIIEEYIKQAQEELEKITKIKNQDQSDSKPEEGNKENPKPQDTNPEGTKEGESGGTNHSQANEESQSQETSNLEKSKPETGGRSTDSTPAADKQISSIFPPDQETKRPSYGEHTYGDGDGDGDGDDNTYNDYERERERYEYGRERDRYYDEEKYYDYYNYNYEENFSEARSINPENEMNFYESIRREVFRETNDLEDSLRDIFIKRRNSKFKAGYKSGKKISIKRRIIEKFKGVSAVDSKAFERRNEAKESDYAITILVDLSGSMNGPKLDQAIKALVALSEALEKIGVKFEILGFNDQLVILKEFKSSFDNKVRSRFLDFKSRSYSNGGYNDDAWALKEASERLMKTQEEQRILIVISDGLPVPSYNHKEVDLSEEVNKVTENTNITLIGVGIGPETEHVSDFYPNSVSNVGITDFPKTFKDILIDAIDTN